MALETVLKQGVATQCLTQSQNMNITFLNVSFKNVHVTIIKYHKHVTFSFNVTFCWFLVCIVIFPTAFEGGARKMTSPRRTYISLHLICKLGGGAVVASPSASRVIT